MKGKETKKEKKKEKSVEGKPKLLTDYQKGKQRSQNEDVVPKSKSL